MQTNNNSDHECYKQMMATCQSIADTLENPPMVLADDPTLILENENYTYDDENDEWLDSDGEPVDAVPMSAFDYLQDALDIEYRIGSDRQYRSAEILVGFGGPNIWIDTATKQVHGAWWGTTCQTSYVDNMGLDDAMEELFNC